MSLIDDFKIRFPNFDPTTVDTLWPQIEPILPCLYGGQYGGGDPCIDNANLYLAAHLFVVISDGQEAPSLVASSESVGSVSVSNVINSAMSDRDSFYSSTGYGQTFLIITGKRQGAFFV